MPVLTVDASKPATMCYSIQAMTTSAMLLACLAINRGRTKARQGPTAKNVTRLGVHNAKLFRWPCQQRASGFAAVKPHRTSSAD